MQSGLVVVDDDVEFSHAHTPVAPVFPRCPVAPVLPERPFIYTSSSAIAERPRDCYISVRKITCQTAGNKNVTLKVTQCHQKYDRPMRPYITSCQRSNCSNSLAILHSFWDITIFRSVLPVLELRSLHFSRDGWNYMLTVFFIELVISLDRRSDRDRRMNTGT